MNLVHFSELTNRQLFSYLLSSLWSMYDLGGISVGRSYPSDLLDAVTNLPSMRDSVPDKHRQLEGEPAAVVEARWSEYESRGNTSPDSYQLCIMFPRKEDVPHFLSTGLEHLSDVEFSLLILIEKKRWYENDAEKEGYLWKQPGRMTKSFVNLLYLMFPEVDTCFVLKHTYTRATLLEEAKNRYKLARKRQDRLEDFGLRGVNPWIA